MLIPPLHFFSWFLIMSTLFESILSDISVGSQSSSHFRHLRPASSRNDSCRSQPYCYPQRYLSLNFLVVLLVIFLLFCLHIGGGLDMMYFEV
ncbi:unnamed protein product [Amoebophrya sp. A25]|nr:unnamed protein product [Amoebophrya sp. A25]|eukprot:GSA25T00006757001.1